jgi:hypothetical protein
MSAAGTVPLDDEMLPLAAYAGEPAVATEVNGKEATAFAFEEAVIGALFIGAAWAEVAGIVHADDYSPPHRMIVAAFAAVAADGKPHDPVTVAQQLEQMDHLQAAGGLAYLLKLANETLTAKNVVAHARAVREQAIKRRLPASHRDADGIEQLRRDLAELQALKEPPAPALAVELRAFGSTEILGPIEPEQYLLPGIPAEAYTLIAGALSSYKTTLLAYLAVWRATGWDLLDLDPAGNGCDIGKCVVASYEDTDKRVFAKLQCVIQHAHRRIRERDGERDALRFVERASANIRRIPLAGRAGAGIVRRVEGAIVPNTEFLESLIAQVQAFAPEGALIGIDPLRLAIAGSQNDDDGADVVVHSMNYLATAIPGSGLIVCSHATKATAQAQEPASGYASASYGTAGSALYSQHARSNFLMARLKASEIRDLFDPADVTAAEAERQLVVKLTHGRLSHGTERGATYLVMRDGILARAEPRAAKSATEVITGAAALIIPAIDRLKPTGLRLSVATLESDGPLVKAVGSVGKVRKAVALLLQAGYLESTGKTRDRDLIVTETGRALIPVANHRESSNGGEP